MKPKKNGNSIFNSGLKRKTLLITGLIILLVISIQFMASFIFLDISINQCIDYVKHGFDTNIKTAVETVISCLKANYQSYLDGEQSEETALKIAKDIVRNTRYSSGTPGQSDDGYFWADMADGLCVVHYNPANEGKMRWDWQDQEGTYFIRNFIKLGDRGGGYSDFYFGKPGDESGSYKKRGYTQKFEPYGWYISTGNYYENTDKVLSQIENFRSVYFFTLLGISIFIAAAGLILMSKNLNSVVAPILKISDRVRRLSMGDTSAEPFDYAAGDEIGNLQNDISKVTNTLHKLMKDIHVMIEEQEKGNIDYAFDTTKFSGDYKMLADSVLELASFGMCDQLTGIPNRRSFDNRLDMEWKRAVREKAYVSLLILDIDKFKNYNDTYGHRQGDAALRTIAKVIKDSVKRSTDFAARWGGEEFVVLLPSTDSDGAATVAETLRKNVENTKISCVDDSEAYHKLTVSIGANTIIPVKETHIGNFVSAADAALYEAKEGGRNRIVIGKNEN